MLNMLTNKWEKTHARTKNPVRTEPRESVRWARFQVSKRFSSYLWLELALHDQNSSRLVDKQLVLVAKLDQAGPVVRSVEHQQILQAFQNVLQEVLQMSPANMQKGGHNIFSEVKL